MALFVSGSVLAGCDGGLKLQKVDSDLVAESVDFGPVQVGDHQVKHLRLTNASRAPIHVRAIKAAAPFGGITLPEALTIPAGESRTVELAFSPQAEGPQQQVAAIESDADHVTPVPLKGFGARVMLALAPASLDFGNVPFNSSRSLSVLVSNQGNVAADLSIEGITGADAELFSASGPGLVPAHGQATLTVSLVAHQLGVLEGSLQIRGCPVCSAQSIALLGHGIASNLEVSPSTLDFGNVALGTSATRTVQLANNGQSPVTVSDVYVTAGSSPDFTATSGTYVLQPGDRKTVSVQLAPSDKGARSGTLRVVSDDPTAPRIDVALSGAGDARATFVDPTSLDFGTVAVGMTSTQAVTVFNTSASMNLTVTSAQVVQGVRFAGGLAGPQTIAPGDHLSIPVAYAPTQAGTDTGSLQIVTDEGGSTTVAVSLTGKGVDLPPCSWAAHPGQLDFGTARPGELRTLAVDIENTGTDDCSFANVQLTAASDPSFTQPDGPIGSRLLHPGEWLTVRISFDPASLGSFAGNLQFFVSNPSNPVGQVPISGAAANGCLTLHPIALDFGAVAGTCPAPQLQLQAENGCTAPVNITSVALGAGHTTEFQLVAGNTGPHALAGGATESYTVSYAPQDDSLDDQSVVFTLADGTTELATLQGMGVMSPTHTDHFSQQDRQKVDQLFVIDNSGSMADKQDALAANFQAFLQQAVAQNIDFHIAVTTTGMAVASGGWTQCPGGAEGGEAGRFFPVDNSSPRVLTPTTPNLDQAFATDVHVGTCHWLEQGLDAARAALTQPLVGEVDDPTTSIPNDGNAGFLRSDARLSIIVVSDADDNGSEPVADYEQFFKGVKGGVAGQFVFSAIVTPDNKAQTCPNGESSGDRYMALAGQTGGVIESVCSSDWGATLAHLSLAAFGPTTHFPLSGKPSDTTQIVVTVNGQQVTAGWSYDPASNSVNFNAASAPPAGSNVEVTYPVGC